VSPVISAAKLSLPVSEPLKHLFGPAADSTKLNLLSWLLIHKTFLRKLNGIERNGGSQERSRELRFGAGRLAAVEG
jgi:hypothetical protein